MKYETWINDFMNAWKERDVEAVMKTISKDCKYYENVFDEPCKSFEDIRKLWEVVPANQKDIDYSYNIVMENDEFCIINFFIKRTLIPSGVIQNINGIFQISLDKDGLCTFFKQWRSVKEVNQ